MSKKLYIFISFALFFVFSAAVFIFTFVSLNRSGVHVYISHQASEAEILTGNDSASSKPSATDSLSAGIRINICTADQDELCTLPGIGPALASAIIEYRTANGDFASPEDIMLVPGIAEGKYLAISDYICVN